MIPWWPSTSEVTEGELCTYIIRWCCIGILSIRSGGWINTKMSSYQYRKSHCGDKTILWPSYPHNGISYTDKMTSSYWIRALDTVALSYVYNGNPYSGKIRVFILKWCSYMDSYAVCRCSSTKPCQPFSKCNADNKDTFPAKMIQIPIMFNEEFLHLHNGGQDITKSGGTWMVDNMNVVGLDGNQICTQPTAWWVLRWNVPIHLHASISGDSIYTQWTLSLVLGQPWHELLWTEP